MSDRLDEFNLSDHIPGVSHAKSFFQRRAGKKQAENISRMIMKKYMAFLGRNKLKATVTTILQFIDRSMDDNEDYMRIVQKEAVRRYKTKKPGNINVKLNPQGQMQGQAALAAPQRGIAPPSPPAGAAPQNPGPTPSPSPSPVSPAGQAQQQKPLSSQPAVRQAAEILNRDITDPNKITDTLKALHTVVSTAYEEGGENKDEVQKWLSTARQNQEIATKNPKLMRALRGESANQLFDFASFLVEYDVRDRDEFRGAMNFLFEAGEDFATDGNANTEDLRSNEPEQDANFSDDASSEKPEERFNQDAMYDKFKNAKLPRSVVSSYLYLIAAEMINSGDYSYDKKAAKDSHGGYGGHGGRGAKNTKIDNHDGRSPPNLRGGVIDLDAFERFARSKNVNGQDIKLIADICQKYRNPTVAEVYRYIQKNKLHDKFSDGHGGLSALSALSQSVHRS